MMLDPNLLRGLVEDPKDRAKFERAVRRMKNVNPPTPVDRRLVYWILGTLTAAMFFFAFR